MESIEILLDRFIGHKVVVSGYNVHIAGVLECPLDNQVYEVDRVVDFDGTIAHGAIKTTHETVLFSAADVVQVVCAEDITIRLGTPVLCPTGKELAK